MTARIVIPAKEYSVKKGDILVPRFTTATLLPGTLCLRVDSDGTS